MEQAVIYMEEEIKCYGKRYVVKGWKNIKKMKELPPEYIETYPCFYVADTVLCLFITKRVGLIDSDVRYFMRGEKVDEEKWDEEYLPVFKKAGERLGVILNKPEILEFKI